MCKELNLISPTAGTSELYELLTELLDSGMLVSLDGILFYSVSC